MRERTLARLIPVRPWIALTHFLLGAAITVPSFYLHNLWGAILGLLILGGAPGSLLLPLPYSR